MSENLPTISIVIPTYNGSKYIRQSIDSCLNQTYHNIELIIVDDCSTDDTPNIIKSYQNLSIKYIRHEKNRGLPDALNTGFKNASGDYLTWASDDNYYTADAIEKMLKFLIDNKCNFVYTDYFLFTDDIPAEYVITKTPDKVKLDINNCIGACFLYTKEVRDAIGEYYSDTFLAEDYDYWLRVSKKFEMLHLAEPLCYYRLHGGSLTAQYLKQYEVQITCTLVRLRNNNISIENTNKVLIITIIQKKLDKHKMVKSLIELIKPATFNLIEPYEIIYRIINGVYYKKIDRISNDVYEGKTTIIDARKEINNLV